ncbi:MAG: NifU family protein [Candidatus Limnocylindria bacterium]
MADLKERVGAKLAEMAPYLERSGARVELLGVEDSIAQVRVELTRPGPSRLVVSLQVKSGIERLLKGALPDLRGVEALNLPPHTLIGWDQPALASVDVPAPEPPAAADGAASS